jgi:hypothetical protein
LGLAGEVSGSALQLLVNVSATAIAGWVTLTVQQLVWRRVALHRRKLLARR